MRSSGSTIVTVGMRGRSPFKSPEVTSPAADDRATTVLHLPTEDLCFGLYGSPDELLDFASDIVSGVYSWILTNGHSDWLDGQTVNREEKAEGNGGNGQ